MLKQITKEQFINGVKDKHSHFVGWYKNSEDDFLAMPVRSNRESFTTHLTRGVFCDDYCGDLRVQYPEGDFELMRTDVADRFSHIYLFGYNIYFMHISAKLIPHRIAVFAIEEEEATFNIEEKTTKKDKRVKNAHHEEEKKEEVSEETIEEIATETEISASDDTKEEDEV